MIKQLIVFAFLISVAFGEIYTLGGFRLLSSISDAQALNPDLQLVEGRGITKEYMVHGKGGFTTQLFFFKNNSGEYYLARINIIKDGVTYSDYVEVSNEFAKLQERSPDIVSTPGVLPWYSSNWNSEFTHFGVIFHQGLGRLMLELKIP